MEEETLQKLDKLGPLTDETDCVQARDERHLFTCRLCGQVFDMRSLQQTAHHNWPGHVAMTEPQLAELASH